MPFLTQETQNNCGAFCICYLEWLDAGRSPEDGPQDGDRDRINSVYNFVQFGDGSISGLPRDHCDPTRMLALLQVSRDTSFYLAPTSPLKLILNAMKSGNARQRAYIDALESEGKLICDEPPFPTAGKAAIAVYDVSDPKAKRWLGQHYLLFREEQGKVSCYNPWDGLGVPVAGYREFSYREGLLERRLSPTGAILLVQ